MSGCGCREAGCPHAGRKGAWLETISGKRFYPADPRSTEVFIGDIAHALSRQCRFGGHVREHYSVAQHSVLCSWNVPKEDALWALLHDASEAYVVDLPSPVKWILRDWARAQGTKDPYAEAEKLVQAAICDRFGLPAIPPASVKIADMRALFTERRDLLPLTAHLWEDQANFAPFEERIVPMTCEQARGAFLERFDSLYEAKYGNAWSRE